MMHAASPYAYTNTKTNTYALYGAPNPFTTATTTRQQSVNPYRSSTPLNTIVTARTTGGNAQAVRVSAAPVAATAAASPFPPSPFGSSMPALTLPFGSATGGMPSLPSFNDMSNAVASGKSPFDAMEAAPKPFAITG
jgi:hypothetical protein